MVATYSPNSRLTKQGDNDNPNSWGDVLNDQVIELIDELVCGVATVDISGSSNVNLASATVNGGTDTARHAVLKLTGTLGANIDLIVPAVEKTYSIITAYTGSYEVRVIPSGAGSGLSFTTGQTALIVTNGTSITKIADITPPSTQSVSSGMMVDWGGTIATVPSGWLFCDGSAVSRATYADLFTAIGTTHGIGNGTTTFNLPNTVNRFTVGAQQDDSSVPKTNITGSLLQTGGAASVTLVSGNIPSHTHAFSGSISATTDSAGSHSHTIPTCGLGSSTAHVAGSVPTGGVSGSVGSGGSGSTSSSGSHSHSVTGTVSGTTDATGSGTAFSIVNPFIALPKIIKT